MHPMERLRYVARAEGTPQRLLVAETADALLDVVDDHAGLVTACRQMVQRQPTAAALVWLAAHLLDADDPRTVAWDLVDAIEEDPTARELAHDLAADAVVVTHGWPEVVTDGLGRRGDLTLRVLDGPVVARRLPEFAVEPVEGPFAAMAAAIEGADVVVLEAMAAGPSAFVADVGATAVAACARHLAVPVTLVVPLGRSLPPGLWNGVVKRLPPVTVGTTFEVVDAGLVDRVVGPVGPSSLSDAVHAADCPAAPELQ